MALVTLTLGILLVPRLDWPISDETFYAGPAFRFAQTGQLLLEPEVQPSLVTLTAWGALFIKAFGGGFLSLRLAVLIAAVLCVVVFYGLLRHLGVERSRCALALAVLVLNPLFLSTSTSFMTEMVFTTCIVAALAAGISGLQRRSIALVFGAGLSVGAAFLTRQIGIVLLLPLAAGLAMHVNLRRSPVPWLALVLPPVLALLGFAFWRYASPGATSTTAFTFAWALEQWGRGPSFALELVRRLASMLVYLGAFTLPLLLIYAPSLWTRLRRIDPHARYALAIGLALAWIGYGLNWSSGQAQLPYLGNSDHPLWNVIPQRLPGGLVLPPWSWPAAISFVLWSTGGLVLGLALGALPSSPSCWWRHPHFPFYATGLLLGLASIVSYVVYDRYFFPLLPFALMICLVALRGLWLSWPLAVLICCLSGALSVGFLLDKDQRAAFSWSVAEAVARGGIPVHQIDAGFEWAYWWYFWERYPVGEGPPGTLGAYRHISQRPYRLASAPLPDHEVVQTYMYTSFLGGRPRPLYVLRVTARPDTEPR